MRYRLLSFFIAAIFIIVATPGAAFAQEDIGLPVGQKAPDFTAVTYEGKDFKLSDAYQNGPVVLIFYRGGWCPYCNLQLKQFQSRLNDLKSYDAKVVAVSVDKQQKAAQLVKKQDLGFEVISNPEAGILKKYGLVYHVPESLVVKYKTEYGIDLEADSGETHHIISIPGVYIIDTTGKIVFASVNRDYKVRVSPQEVLDVLANIRAK